MESTPPLSAEQLEDLQLFLRDWLRHAGRTQSDLRRALRAPSIRMPVLVEVLQRIHSQQGLGGVAEHLCQIETLWHCEDTGSPPSDTGSWETPDPMDQLDLLLDEIRTQEPST